MVVFVCNSCNDSLKKSGVGVHLMRCRSSVISCCDCGKEFTGDSYKEHTQCISEDAKYGPQGQQSGDIQDKGQKKQNDWLNNIKQALTKVNLSGPAEMALNKLLEFPNIPRKKLKFVNFTRSCVKIRSDDIIEQLWNICESAKVAADETQKSQAETNVESLDETLQSTDEVTEGTKSNKKDKKKRKKQDDNEPESGETVPVSGDDQEKSEENSSQTNGDGDNPKKTKKKKKLESKENEQENGKPDETSNGDKENEATESSGKLDDQQEEENLEENSEKSKKSKKKKKRNHSEVLDTDQLPETNTDQLSGNLDENENESKKKSKTEEETSVDEKMDQESIDHKADSISNELTDNSNNQINWFKQLKRSIKEKQTMELKELKKLVKRLKKDHNLDEDFSDLFTKAQVKLMKRKNYSISEGQIKYEHLF